MPTAPVSQNNRPSAAVAREAASEIVLPYEPRTTSMPASRRPWIAAGAASAAGTSTDVSSTRLP
jgi:hypothetical protein